MDDKESCKELIKKLTFAKQVSFTNRGNTAIKLALKIAKDKGYKKVLVQDQGGWITYKQFAKKFEIIELKTNRGIMSPDSLTPHKDSVLLINSMPGYYILEDMEGIGYYCGLNNLNTFTINDVSGSIGTDKAKFGDLMLGSFGIDKPINLGTGGFLASVKDDNLPGQEDADLDYTNLKIKLENLSNRLKMLKEIKERIIVALKAKNFERNILKGDGINIIVSFSDEPEKETLINLAKKEGVEHTICPRDIRVREDAVCFEIKRL